MRVLMRVVRPCRVRAPWRSRVRRSLQVWKIDSIRCRIGARCRLLAGFVFALRPDDRGVELGGGVFEVAAGVVFVAEHEQRARRVGSAASRVRQTSRSVALGEVRIERAWGAVQGEQAVQAEAPEEAAVDGAAAVVGGVSELAALASSRRCARTRPGSSRRAPGRRGSPGCRLANTSINDSIVSAQTLPALADSQAGSASSGNRCASCLRAILEKPRIGRDPHDRLRDAERDDLRVCQHPPRVVPRAGDRRRCRTPQSATGRGRRASWPPWVDARQELPTST